MGLKLALAEAIGAASTWVLRNIFRRPAANFPGKVGLYADAQLIADLRERLREGSVVVVGTNGKTTVTNLLADSFEAAGKSVACNRTGANLDSGVATALLDIESADWGVFESDELWIAKILPQLQANYVVLLNLFRDQLDRMGEIDHMQEAIANALADSPETVLIYNADDPLCQAVAERVENASISFGIDEDLGLAQNTVVDAGMCQRCDSILVYEWRQYGQLGAFRCPTCGFERQQPAYTLRDVTDAGAETTVTVCFDGNEERIAVPFAGAYMLYNVLAVCAVASCCGLSMASVEEAIRSFAPDNGRQQRYDIDGHAVLLNLAKNPIGFNQNLRIVLGEPGPKAVAFFINDKEADGHDVSWLWDVDFQELANVDELAVFAGGLRRHDMQVRLKYVGVKAALVDGAEDFLAKAAAELPDAHLFLIANYTALPEVKAELDYLCAQSKDATNVPSEQAGSKGLTPNPETSEGADAIAQPASQPESLLTTGEKLTILYLYPDLLNLYGDGGNVIVLADRACRRGIDVDVIRVNHGDVAQFADADIVFLGGGPDREQHLASLDLLEQADGLRAYVEDDGVLLAICGGYQILGREWLLGGESVPGLGILDLTTTRAEGGSHNRLVGNVVLDSPLAHMPVVGYENHAGRTYLGEKCTPFGSIVGRHGKGNNGEGKADGMRYRNVVGTYLHGPLLAKNPEVADWLIARALERRAANEGREAAPLMPLDDSEERAANEFMRHKLGAFGS